MQRSFTLSQRPGIQIESNGRVLDTVEVSYEAQDINTKSISEVIERETDGLPKELQSIAIDAAINGVMMVHEFNIFREMQK